MFEQHGGGTIRDTFYWFLAFYLPEKHVGFYGGSKNYFETYRENRIRLKGKISQLSDDHIEFYIYNVDKKQNIKFSGQIIGETLHLTYYHEHEPGEVSYDIFEYVGE